jgi:uncharacterized protein YqgV (UPF0045/DUF77 family)
MGGATGGIAAVAAAERQRGSGWIQWRPAITPAAEDSAMRIAVDISLYPLAADYIPPIQDFIDRLNRHAGLHVETNAMSTQVAGEHGTVFAALEAETRRTFDNGGRAVFVMKVLGGEPSPAERRALGQ